MLFCIVEEKSQDAALDGTLAVLVAGMLYVRRLGFKRVKCQNGGAPFQVFPMERFKCGSVVISPHSSGGGPPSRGSRRGAHRRQQLVLSCLYTINIHLHPHHHQQDITI